MENNIIGQQLGGVLGRRSGICVAQELATKGRIGSELGAKGAAQNGETVAQGRFWLGCARAQDGLEVGSGQCGLQRAFG